MPPEAVSDGADVAEPVEVVLPEPVVIAEAELIPEPDEDDEPQPNVTPDGRPVGAGPVGAGKAKQIRGRRKTAAPRPPRAAAVEAQRHAKTAKPRARKRAGAN